MGTRFIQRYKCNCCQKKFSNATGTLEFGQKKRRVNSKLFGLLNSNMSMRRAAKFLNISRTTVDRKFIYLAKKAELQNKKFIASQKQKVMHLQFDDLITSEHTKLKPLAISLAVDADRRFILGLEVSVIGAFGHLVQISRRKYGPRINNHKEGLERLFTSISGTIHLNAKVSTDEDTKYAGFVKKHLPHREHLQYKGGRGAIVGQGELKKLKYDPLFMLNHSCAMLRANINRLARKTWCTTKLKERLKMHLDIFMSFYNLHYLRGKAPLKEVSS